MKVGIIKKGDSVLLAIELRLGPWQRWYALGWGGLGEMPTRDFARAVRS